MINASAKAKLAAVSAVLLALLVAPAPLLPPHRLAEAMEAMLGVSWHAAYFVAGLGLIVCFYGALGVLAAFTVKRAPTSRGLLLQIVVVPLFVVGAAMLIRSIKVGYFPVWITAAIPLAACLCGVAIGLGFVYRRGVATLVVTVAALGAALWGLLGGTSGKLSRVTEAQLRVLIEAVPRLPAGDARFGALMQTAFVVSPLDAASVSAVEQNRAAILALGVAIGHERLAPLAGLPAQGEWVHAAELLRGDTTLRGDANLARHFCLSAALTVLGNPALTDAGGLMKELADFEKAGSGFSFNDIAADRAGVRFAIAATQSEAAAKAMQARLRNGFVVDDFLPPVADLPEHLTMEQFRRDFGGVGAQRYRQQIAEIESRLDRCAALSPHAFTP